MSKLTPQQQKLKDEFIAAKGYWADLWDGTLEMAPEFFEAYLEFARVPWRTGVLEPKVKELIFIAVDAATTHLYEPGLRIHMRNAMEQGATRDEIMEVLQLVSVLGLHSVTEGVPALVDEFQKAGRGADVEIPEFDENQNRLKDEFVRTKGYWSDYWDQVLGLTPEFFEAYLRLAAVPWETGVLEPKVKELIFIAIDASTTHLYERGLRIHIRNAMDQGATREEIMEVLQLISALGIHACTMGVPVLVDELEKAQQRA